jgi:hypothetical protein
MIPVFLIDLVLATVSFQGCVAHEGKTETKVTTIVPPVCPSLGDGRHTVIELSTKEALPQPFTAPATEDAIPMSMVTREGGTLVCGRRNLYLQRPSEPIQWFPEIGCSILMETASGSIFFLDEYGPSRIGFSVDDGRSWRIADLSPIGLSPTIAFSPRADEILFMDDSKRLLWHVRVDNVHQEMVVTLVGNESAGDQPPQFGFFSPRKICVPQHDLTVCTDNMGDSWRVSGNVKALSEGVVSGSRWWTLEEKNLFSCLNGSLAWEKVSGTELCHLYKLTATEKEAWAIGMCNPGHAILRLNPTDGTAKTWSRFPLDFFYYTGGNTFKASSGGLALVSNCGIYVLEGHQLVLRVPSIPYFPTNCPTRIGE